MTKDQFKVDFIGIGAEKSATTWIAQCLQEHPKICVSIPKEVNFFNKSYWFLRPHKEWNYPKGIRWYKKHFKHCKDDQVKGEFSVHYMFDSDTAKLIKETFPKVRIICSLRNPIERAHSKYQSTVGKYGRIFKSFEEAIKKEPEFIERGYYFKQLKPYYELFPRENILVLIYEDIQRNPVKFIQKIYRFLGVDDSFIPPSATKRINATQLKWGPGIKFLRESYLILTKLPFGKKISKIAKIMRIKKLVKLVDLLAYRLSLTPKINHSTRNYLIKIFKEDINNLEKLINRDLSFWK